MERCECTVNIGWWKICGPGGKTQAQSEGNYTDVNFMFVPLTCFAHSFAASLRTDQQASPREEGKREGEERDEERQEGN